MTQGDVLAIFREGMLVALKMAGPLLIISIVVGLIVAVFQAATQIHEQTLTFVPKVLAIAIILLVGGSWMISLLNDFVSTLFEMMTRF